MTPNTELTHSLTRSLTHSLTQTRGGETGTVEPAVDAAKLLLAISLQSAQADAAIPFEEVIQTNQLAKTDALLCFEWSFREWQGVDRSRWPEHLRTAPLDYSKYVQRLMERNKTKDPLSRFNEATPYIRKSRVKTFGYHIETALLQTATTSVIEKAGAKFFVCALAASTYQAPLAFPPHRLNDC